MSAADRRREDVVQAHMPLVGHLVREMLTRVPAHVNRDDLLSAGYAALVHAARGYDDERGVPFARFAAARVRGALLDELRGLDWASRSVRQRAVVFSLQGFATVGADDMVTEPGAGPEELLIRRERLGYLRDAIDALPERLRAVVQGYFFEERPMARIAEELGVTESRVSQLRAEALTLLRDGLNTHLDPALAAQNRVKEGCVARRRAAYYDQIGNRGTLSSRLARTSLDGLTVAA